jgi:cytidylate kinase
MRNPIIAIDGPAGAGKSSVAKMVAKELGFIYIDTGAMYRGIALKSIQQGVPVSDIQKITTLAVSADIHFKKDGDSQQVILDDEDVTELIRSPEATRLSSPVSTIAGVRKSMVEMQRKMGAEGGVVMEGRDIGTVVFPDAEVKIYLTASAMERAKRRALEMAEKGVEADVEKIAAEIRERDLRDSSRAHSPLKQASDAVLVDTDNMSFEQVVASILDIYKQKVS